MSFSGSLCTLLFPPDEPQRRKSKRQMSECTHWWLFTPTHHFAWTIKGEPAHSSPLCARSLPFGWSHASFNGLVPPWTPLNERMLWAGALFRSNPICAYPGHHVLCLSFQPPIRCETGAHTPSQHCLSPRPRQVTRGKAMQLHANWISVDSLLFLAHHVLIALLSDFQPVVYWLL